MSSSSRLQGLFGSPEDDPLLHDAPDTGDPSSTDEDVSTAEDALNRPSGRETPSTPSSTEDTERKDRDGDRILIISTDKAQAGRIAPLKTALRRGWALSDIRLAGDAQASEPSSAIAFRLTRDD